MTPCTLYDNRNHRIELGPLLATGRGGEGKVYEVVGLPSSVAKVYDDPPDARKEQKLRIMPALARPDLLTVAAWPTATLHKTPQGQVVGFLMPNMPGKEIHELFGPTSRKQKFPTADWAFLIHTAKNCAIAFNVLHGAGHVMGDVNERNFHVCPKAMVYLLDCDSYQFIAGGQSFPCGVGTDLYTPPELQDQNLAGVVRTQNHDHFGLAVLIFQLLFVGRHPFCGRPLTRGELLPGKAIKEFRFAFSRAAAQLQIAPPPRAPLLDIVPAEVARLFERAFSKYSAQPSARPTAQDWIAGLNILQKQLRVCSKDAGHKFSAHLSQCCWCDLMQAGAPNYFISVTVYRAGTTIPTLTFVLGAAWAEIERVPRPSAVYLRPSLPASSRIAPTALPAHIPWRVPPRVVIPRETLHKIVGWTAVGNACLLPVIGLAVVVVAAATSRSASGGSSGMLGLGAFAVIAALTFGLWWLVLELKHQSVVRGANSERDEILADMRCEKDRRRQAYQKAHRDLEEAENEWVRAAAWYEQSFDELKRRLQSLKNDYLSLKTQYEQELRDLEKNKEAAQRIQFLQTQFISDHDIPGIGPTREAVLRSNGIETAYDIQRERILEIDGFGPGLTGNLLAWKEQVSRSFRFNAAAAVSPSELAALVVKHKQFQQRIESRLQPGLEDLQQCSHKAARHLAQLYAGIPTLISRLAQAKIDAQLLSVNVS
ncbi:MAG TPA: hypothetical protein VH682_00560 [Gemmataceae bacterium]|jgi:DNA-binding helix-hairpin-helix protein with protein kinase domain